MLPPDRRVAGGVKGGDFLNAPSFCHFVRGPPFELLTYTALPATQHNNNNNTNHNNNMFSTSAF